MISFVLTNGPSAFMDLMNRVFRKCLDRFIIVFIGDVFVDSRSENDHMDHLKVVLQILKDHTLFAKFNKCELLLNYMAFLGHIVSRKGVEVDPKKTDSVKKWPRPVLPTNIRSFFGSSRLL